MMVATHSNDIENEYESEEGEFTESGSEEEEEEEEEEEGGEYSDEIIDDFDEKFQQTRVPKTFEQFSNMYKPQPQQEDVKKTEEPKAVEQEVEREIEERILAMPEASKSQINPQKTEEIVENIEQNEILENFETEMDLDDEEEDEDEELIEEEEELSGK